MGEVVRKYWHKRNSNIVPRSGMGDKFHYFILSHSQSQRELLRENTKGVVEYWEADEFKFRCNHSEQPQHTEVRSLDLCDIQTDIWV